MLSHKTSILIIILTLVLIIDGLAQTRNTRNSDRINKSVIIDLQNESQPYFKSFFQAYRSDGLHLQSQVPEFGGKFTYHKNVVQLDDFDYIRIVDKKKTFFNSVLSGLIIGTASFFIAKELSRNKDPRNLALINQTGSSGAIEGTLAGGLGFGLGIIVYDGVFNRKLSIANDKNKIIKKLKNIRL